MINFDNLGAIHAVISKHVTSHEVKAEADRFPKYAVIGLGQGGGRMAAEFARFGLPTYIVNSSKTDMDEHKKIIPDANRIFTPYKDSKLEGTNKNIQTGKELAIENKKTYQELVLKEDVENAEFVWVCVSLGGGTGNGAIRVALSYLSQRRRKKGLIDGKVPLGVICSLPAKSEYGSTIRSNALAGIAYIQSLINDGTIGSVLVVDNEKMARYYDTNPLQTKNKTEIDAKSYTNMMVASLIMETSSLPLLSGRQVLDKTELLATFSTPGWLSISRQTGITSEDKLEGLVETLYKNNEVFAQNDISNSIMGAIGVVHPTSKKLSPETADRVTVLAQEVLETQVNVAIVSNSALSDVQVYGLAVTTNQPSRVLELDDERDRMKQKEDEKKTRAKEQANNSPAAAHLGLFNSSSSKNNSESLEEFEFEDDFAEDFCSTKVKVAPADELEDDFEF